MLSFNAASALDFLMTESVDGYLEFMDMEPSTFRKYLIKMMADDSPKEIAGLDSMARRTFRQNFAIWKDLHERLGRRVVDDQSQGWTSA